MAIKVTTCFQNRVAATDLIFKDAENKGVNIIYYPELGNSGIEFANKYRKKNYWDYILIPPAFMFLSHKVFTNNYLKSFKKTVPQIRVQRKFLKNGQPMRSVVVDLTPLSENFTAFSKSKSKKQSMDAFFELLQKFITDNSVTDKSVYLVIDGHNLEEKEMAETLFYYSRLNSNRLRISGLEGILFYGNKRYWPVTITETDKEGKYLKININMFSRYMKEVHAVDTEEEQATPEESVEYTKNVVKALYKVHEEKLKSSAGALKHTTKTDEIEENPIELIKSEVQQNKYLAGNSFEEKLTNLFNAKPKIRVAGKKETTSNIKEPEDKAIKKTIKNISRELEELNKKYNGTLTIEESQVDRNQSSFYKPLNIIGFNDFSAYKKQETEFGDNLDQAMFDLLKSLETDKDLGIKILNIKTEITDTNRDRLKTYKIKLQHKSFGWEKPYTVSFHVPIPSKGKYLKVGGNDYIMINQFYSKPVIKVSPKRVRLYTQFATCSVHLKHHALNDEDGVKETLYNMELQLKHAKKLKAKPTKLDNDTIEDIKAKWDLPDNIDSGLFVNLEIKE
jgi:hypothetical protein